MRLRRQFSSAAPVLPPLQVVFAEDPHLLLYESSYLVVW